MLGGLRVAVSMELYYRGAILRTHFLDRIKCLDFAFYLKSIVRKLVREGKQNRRASNVSLRSESDLSRRSDWIGHTRALGKAIKLEKKFYFVR